MPPPAPESAWATLSDCCAAVEEAILNCDTDLKCGESGKEHNHLKKSEIQYQIYFLVIVKEKIFLSCMKCPISDCRGTRHPVIVEKLITCENYS
jgi:ssDNA-binding Zn-finger/Zn-ribbon topoisomerase 1